MNDEPHCKLAISVLVQFKVLAHAYFELIYWATDATFDPKEVGIDVSNKVIIS